MMEIYSHFAIQPSILKHIEDEKDELDYIYDIWYNFDSSAKEEDPQPLTSYVSMLKEYVDMDQNIRRVMENHVKFIKQHETSQQLLIDGSTKKLTKQW